MNYSKIEMYSISAGNRALTLAGQGQALLLYVPLTHAYANIHSPRRKTLGLRDILSAKRYTKLILRER